MSNFRSFLFLILFFSSFVLSLEAQTSKKESKVDNEAIRNDSILDIITDVDGRIVKYNARLNSGGLQTIDKISTVLDKQSIISNIHIAKRNQKGMIIFPYTITPFGDEVSFRDTVIFEPSLLPVVFDGQLFPNNLDFRQKDERLKGFETFHLINPDSTFAPNLKRVEQIGMQRRHFYTRNLDKVHLDASTFADISKIKVNILEEKNPLKELLSVDQETVALVKPNVETVKIKPTRWKYSGVHKLHIMQNAVTKYWEGAQKDNNVSLDNHHEFNINFKKDKISFDNRFRWDLQVQSSPADTIHKVTVPKDMFELYSVFAVKSFLKNWSYAVTLQMKTPFFNSYPKNGKERQRSFLSPLELNPSIGISYRLEKKYDENKHRNLKLNIDLSPFSLDYTYVSDKKVDPTKHKIEAGKHARTIYGHKLRADLLINFNRFARFKSDLEVKTDYSSVLAISRNEFSYALNRFFSLSMNFDMRFDDAMKYEQKDENLGYFQYNQRMTFGLTYNW